MTWHIAPDIVQDTRNAFYQKQKEWMVADDQTSFGTAARTWTFFRPEQESPSHVPGNQSARGKPQVLGPVPVLVLGILLPAGEESLPCNVGW